MSFSSSQVSNLKNVDGNVIVAPSKAFQHGIIKVSLSLLFFVATYLLVVATFLGFAFFSIVLCYAMLSQDVNFFTVFLGLGLIGLDLMVIYFLIKFIFQKNVVDRSEMIEINSDNEPMLFRFVKEITEETNTPFPKKIFLAPHVNAGVFYDSSFWSMFLPVQKNLQIGLGLVNSTNIMEFKAALAHEFAHFSQKSMRFGSYVYYVNSIIYNMLYDNDGYNKTIQSWARIGGGFSFFARITVWIIIRIQWIMQRLYSVVNRNYMSLSRAMEFHADAMAAVVAGGNNLKTSLLKLEPAVLCYNKLLQFYDLWVNDCIKANNIYLNHRELIKRFALDNNLEWVNNDLAILDIERMNTIPRRVSIKDQWASHPDLKDRIQHLMLMNIVKTGDLSSAWGLFTNPAVLQKAMTAKVYERIEFENEPQTIDNVLFCERIDAYFAKQKFDVRYRGYFDAHDLFAFEPEKVVADITPASSDKGLDYLSKLLNRDILLLSKTILGLPADIMLLTDIIDQKYSIKSFDFDGNKLKVEEASNVRKVLVNALRENTYVLDDLDKVLFRFFYSKALTKGSSHFLISNYQEYIETVNQTSQDNQLIEDMYQSINPFYSERLTVKQATGLNDKAKLREMELRKRIVSVRENQKYKHFLNGDVRVAFQSFLDEDRPYFEEGFVREEVFKLLVDALNAFQEVVRTNNYEIKNNYLNLQLSLFDN